MTGSDEGSDLSRTTARILAVVDPWAGSNGQGFVNAFRRMGASVRVVDPGRFVPSSWRRRSLKATRRTLENVLVRELEDALVREAEALRPDLLLVYKGTWVTPDAVEGVRGLGAFAANVYPDVSLTAHGKWIPLALPLYDHVFTTKSWGIDDLERVCGVTDASLLPHAFDPEVHAPVELRVDEEARYRCDAAFVGTWSPAKQEQLEAVVRQVPGVRLRVWGDQWEKAGEELRSHVEGRGVYGREYAKALCGARVALGLLSEQREGSSSGDEVTARTFEIPGCGAFLLHARSGELAEHFEVGKECADFEGPDGLVEALRLWLADDEGRGRIAAAGHERALRCHTYEHRARRVLEVLDARRGGA